MAKKEKSVTSETVEVLKVGTNALTLPWPQDPQGALNKLKTGGVNAVGRVGSNPEKLERLLKTLAVIEAYAKEKFAKETVAAKKAVADHVSAKARIAERQMRAAEAKAAEYQAAAERVLAEAGVKTVKNTKGGK